MVLWWASSCSESLSLLVWQAVITTPAQGSSRERSPVVSWVSEFLFLDFPATATEQVRTHGFGRNSSSLGRAPKIRDSGWLISLESFFSDLSETGAMHSSAIPWQWEQKRGRRLFGESVFLKYFRTASIDCIRKVPMPTGDQGFWVVNPSNWFYPKKVRLFTIGCSILY